MRRNKKEPKRMAQRIVVREVNSCLGWCPMRVWPRHEEETLEMTTGEGRSAFSMRSYHRTEGARGGTSGGVL